MNKRKLPTDVQLELMTLKLKNEELEKKLTSLEKALNCYKLKVKSYALKLRGAHVLTTKMKKELDKTRVCNSINKFALKDSFTYQKNTASSNNNNSMTVAESMNRTTEFMTKVQFLQHTCSLSYQKASLAINLCFNLFFGMDPPVKYVSSPSTLSAWNIILGECDKRNLRHHFQNTPYECHIWVDDSIKGEY